jgi:hypothetical protein
MAEVCRRVEVQTLVTPYALLYALLGAAEPLGDDGLGSA